MSNFYAVIGFFPIFVFIFDIIKVKEELKTYSQIPIQRHLLLHLLNDYKRPNDKISDMISKGELIALKKGMYILGDSKSSTQPSSFIIANRLYGPSYVSFDSALSYWGLIPERVVETSSVTIKASKKIRTPIGRFSYNHLPLPYYSFGIKQVAINEIQHVLIACPEKAICDKIILSRGVNLRSVKHTISFLFEDLRIDEEALFSLDFNLIENWLLHAPKRKSIEMLIKTIGSK